MLHRSFSHPCTAKIINLLKLARPWKTDEQTEEHVEEIAKNCDTCQRQTTAPVCFKVTLLLEEDLIFGDELSVYLIFLDGNAVLHIIDTTTLFSAATFLDCNGELTDNPWKEYGQLLFRHE